MYLPNNNKKSLDEYFNTSISNGSGLDNSLLIDKEYSLKDAKNFFIKNYIGTLALYLGESKIKNMSKTLNYDRSELSDKINQLGIKDIFNEIKENKNKIDYRSSIDDYIIKSGSEQVDSVTKRVLSEAIINADYHLTNQINRFKEMYTNTIVREHKLNKASKILGVTKRTTRNLVNKYNKNPNNYLYVLYDYYAKNNETKNDSKPEQSMQKKELEKVA